MSCHPLMSAYSRITYCHVIHWRQWQDTFHTNCHPFKPYIVMFSQLYIVILIVTDCYPECSLLRSLFLVQHWFHLIKLTEYCWRNHDDADFSLLTLSLHYLRLYYLHTLLTLRLYSAETWNHFDFLFTWSKNNKWYHFRNLR